MPRTKRQLSGAAKEAHERKRARQQEQNEEEKRDPVDEQRASLEPTGAPAGNLTAEEARRRLDEYVKQGEGDKTAPRLRQFLAVVPAEGKPNIIRDILARDDNQLREFMADIRNSFFRPIKAVGGRTPVPSGQSGSSKSSSSTGRTGQEKLKRDCLRRDNNRCMITNGYDTVKAAQLPESEQNALTLRFPTHCSHIFPYSSGPTVADGQVDGGDLRRVARLWAFIYRYFPAVESRLQIRQPGAIDFPRNAMTMASFVHEAFGAFQLSLDHVEGNAYKIKTYPKFGTFHVFLPQDMRVSFQTATELELPDPQLLKVHNAIAIFFHATGMGDELDLELEGKEDPVVANMVDPAIEGLEGRVNDWLVDVH